MVNCRICNKPVLWVFELAFSIEGYPQHRTCPSTPSTIELSVLQLVATRKYSLDQIAQGLGKSRQQIQRLKYSGMRKIGCPDLGQLLTYLRQRGLAWPLTEAVQLWPGARYNSWHDEVSFYSNFYSNLNFREVQQE